MPSSDWPPAFLSTAFLWGRMGAAFVRPLGWERKGIASGCQQLQICPIPKSCFATKKVLSTSFPKKMLLIRTRITCCYLSQPINLVKTNIFISLCSQKLSFWTPFAPQRRPTLSHNEASSQPSLLQLSEDEEMLRDSAEKFAKEILAPHVQAPLGVPVGGWVWGEEEVLMFGQLCIIKRDIWWETSSSFEGFSRSRVFCEGFGSCFLRVSYLLQEMDQKGAMKKEIVDALFEQGLMGIEAVCGFSKWLGGPGWDGVGFKKE